MEIDKEVLKEALSYQPVEVKKRDWTSFNNGADLLKELQDNGMYWAEAYVQHLERDLPEDKIGFALVWFASAIETAKKISHERFKLKVGRHIDQVADHFGFTVPICKEECQKYDEENRCHICENRKTDPDILAFVDKLLSL